MIVLDTNVVSELMRPRPEPRVANWADKNPPNEVYITAVTAAELLYGARRLPDGRRKATMVADAETLVEVDFDDKVLPFTVDAAHHFADIVIARESRGRPINDSDAQIAAICRLLDAELATRNVKDFVYTGITIIDPWTADPRTGRTDRVEP